MKRRIPSPARLLVYCQGAGWLGQGDGWLLAMLGRWVAKSGRWVAKLVARLLATATPWVRFQTSLKNTKQATYAKECPKTLKPAKFTIKNSIASVTSLKEFVTHPRNQYQFWLYIGLGEFNPVIAIQYISQIIDGHSLHPLTLWGFRYLQGCDVAAHHFLMIGPTETTASGERATIHFSFVFFFSERGSPGQYLAQEAEFLDEIQAKVFIVFLLAIHSHLCSFASRFCFFKLTQPLTVSTVHC